MAALDHAEARDDISGLVITGAGRIFIGGADIREFGRPPAEPHLPAVLDRIEGLARPVVAAVNGAARGDGCEVALTCASRKRREAGRPAFARSVRSSSART